MSFDDRIRSTVDQALAPLVQQLIEAAAVDREEAGRAAKAAAYEEAEEAAKTRIADAEARVRSTLDQEIAQARAEDRESAAREIRQQIESEAEARMRAALETAEERMRTALANSEARAAEDLKTSVAAAQAKERESEMAVVGRLLESVRGLDGATSLSEVLDALALAAAREAARAAVVVCEPIGFRAGGCRGLGPAIRSPSRSISQSRSRV